MSEAPNSDPRVDLARNRTTLAKFRTALALDRTTLAWIRTTLTMGTFGLGMIGFFPQLERPKPDSGSGTTPSWAQCGSASCWC